MNRKGIGPMPVIFRGKRYTASNHVFKNILGLTRHQYQPYRTALRRDGFVTINGEMVVLAT